MLPIYVINLARDVDKWRASSEQLSKFGLSHSRFDAVNGLELSDECIDTYYNHKASRRWTFDMSRPEIGCYLSHYHLWNKIISEPYRGAFIFEDDFVSLPDLPVVLRALSSIDFQHPTIVKLYNEHSTYGEHGSISLTEQHNIVVPHEVPQCTVAYYINRQAARRLIQKRQRFFRPVDEDMFVYWETGVDVFLVTPTPTVGIDDRTDSDIEEHRKDRERRYASTRCKRLHRFMCKNVYYRAYNRVHVSGCVKRMMRHRIIS